MQQLRTHARTCAWACAAGVVLLAAIVSWPRLVLAFNPQPEPPAFGMVGLARTQTARLNLVNLQPPDPAQPPDPTRTCSAILSFVDRAGLQYVDRAGMPVAREVRLGPGQSGFADLRSADVFQDSEARRAQFRATVDFVDRPEVDAPSPCLEAVATLEIFDNLTGRTMVLYTPPAPNTPPDPNAPR